MATILTPGYLRFDGYKYITVTDIELGGGGGGGGGGGAIPSFVSNSVTTTNAPLNLATYTLANKKSVTYVAVVTARNDSNSLSKSWILQRRGVINTGSLVAGSLVSLQDVEVIGGSDPGWTVTIDTIGMTFRVRAVGSSGVTVHWNTYTEIYVSTASDGGGTEPAPVDPPTVSSIYPDIGANIAGMAITITGANFTGATSATVGGTPITGLTVVDATTITGAMPITTAGFLTVAVTTSIGTGSLSNAFASLEVGSGNQFTLHHAGVGVIVSGSDVTSVADQGTIGSAAMLTSNVSVSLPTITLNDPAYNNKATFSFPNLSANMKTASYTINQPVTTFLVGETATETSGYPYYLLDGRSGLLTLYGTSPTSSSIYVSTEFTISANAAIKQVWTTVHNGASSAISASSNTEIIGNTGAATVPDGMTLGSYSGNAYGCNGKIAFVLQIHGVLTSGQRDINRATIGAYYGKTIT